MSDSITGTEESRVWMPESYDQAISATLTKLQGRHQDAAALASEAVHFLSTSASNVDTLRKKGFFGRLMGALTGSNNVLRDNSQININQAQKATLKLVTQLAEQNHLQFDALLALANIFQYAQTEDRKILEKVRDIFISQGNRLRSLEQKLKEMDNEIRINTWVNTILPEDYTQIENKSLRLIAIVNKAYQLRSVQWSGTALDVFETQLRRLEFKREERISIGSFIGDLVDHGLANVLRNDSMLEYAGDGLSAQYFPSYHAVYEVHKLDCADQEYQFITAILSHAASQGAHLQPNVVRKLVAENYLRLVGVNTGAEVRYLDLAKELLYCANAQRDQVTLPTVMQLTDVAFELPAHEVKGLPPALEVPMGCVKLDMPHLGRPIAVMVKPMDVKGQFYDDAVQLLQEQAMRLPTLEEMMTIWTAGMETGNLQWSKWSEWVDSPDRSDNKAWVLGGEDFPDLKVKLRSRIQRAYVRGVRG